MKPRWKAQRDTCPLYPPHTMDTLHSCIHAIQCAVCTIQTHNTLKVFNTVTSTAVINRIHRFVYFSTFQVLLKCLKWFCRAPLGTNHSWASEMLLFWLFENSWEIALDSYIESTNSVQCPLFARCTSTNLIFPLEPVYVVVFLLDLTNQTFGKPDVGTF